MSRLSIYLTLLLLLLSVDARTEQLTVLSTMADLHRHACSIKPYVSQNPWHIVNLYNCAEKELYVPYQLWSGAKWDGNKQSACMHIVDGRTLLSQPSEHYASGEVIIKGPRLWKDSHRDEIVKVWERIRPSTNSHKYLACHPRGIGDVHNVLRPHENYVRGLCRAPAGFGWKLGKRRTCIKTTLEIKQLTLNDNNLLVDLSADYWFRDQLKFRYTYKPNQGTTSIFKYAK